MPKLTNTEYLIRHEMLRRVWGTDYKPFSYLSYQQQRDLHDYYNLSKDGTEEELLKHRAKVTKADPSLPQRASRAFLAILRPEDQPRPVATTSKKKVTIRPLVRPELDVEKIATALIELGAWVRTRQRGDGEAHH